VNWKRLLLIGLFLALVAFAGQGSANAHLWDGNATIIAPAKLHSKAVRDTDQAGPIIDIDPASNLLPPGTEQLSIKVQTTTPTTCAYALNEPRPYELMTRFDSTSFSSNGDMFESVLDTTHYTIVSGLDPNPNTVNKVYVRCASQPDYLQELLYRARSTVNPPFPRAGNLWGGWGSFKERDLAYIAQRDLLLGANWLSTEKMATLRDLNPDIYILTSINTVEPHASVPDDYYLKDVDGNKIESWPGKYYLNLTKDYVAEFQAQNAYQTLIDHGMMADGVFFDNVFTKISNHNRDIYGNLHQIDSDEDGLPDDPETLDAAWKAGVFHEINTFRSLAPNAILSGHGMNINESGIADLFNGISIGFRTADVIQGDRTFAEIWKLYNAWIDNVNPPAITMFESSPLDEIAYGYGYDPRSGTIPSSTLEFARTYYPWMRFGLALTLLNDGYFAHEFGDILHGNDWWYDELDFNLGYPLGPAQRVDLGAPPQVNQIENGDFEDPIEPPWYLRVSDQTGSEATLTQDTGDAISGSSSARIDVLAASGTNWHVEFAQHDRSLYEGVNYDLNFWAKSDRSRNITLSAQKDAPDWDNYGLQHNVSITTQWQPYTVTFQANATVTDSRIQFWMGETTGTVWLDDVRLTEHPTDVYQREYSGGMVLLNATQATQVIDVKSGFRRGVGDQASLYETILDDTAPQFSTTGEWTNCSYDSGLWKVSGPYYHDWGEGCHERTGGSGEARWDVPITAFDTYTVTAWWPAAPESAGWSQNATYELIAGGKVVGSTSLDQRTGGDEWHFIAEAYLSPGDHPYVRLSCSGSAPCIADALHLRSSARYNNGSPVKKITLQPMDGILLVRNLENEVYLPMVLR
jgi:hypothetical protein